MTKKNNIKQPRVRNEYSPRLRVTLDCKEPGKTQQHFKDECDINRIVSHFQETGQINHLRASQPEYGFASSQSFTEAMYIVAQAEQEFAALPSAIRSHFSNNPAEFLDAAHDETRRPEFVELGLLEPLPRIEVEVPAEPLSEALPQAPDTASSDPTKIG